MVQQLLPSKMANYKTPMFTSGRNSLHADLAQLDAFDDDEKTGGAMGGGQNFNTSFGQ